MIRISQRRYLPLRYSFRKVTFKVLGLQQLAIGAENKEVIRIEYQK